jgi:CubicO group peptidase (beta-lactamase class C family)
MNSKFFVLLIALACIVQVHSFGHSGHRVVCAIATTQFTPATQQFVQDILKNYVGPTNVTFTSLFDIASYAYNLTTIYPWSNPWHYVYLLREFPIYNSTRDCKNNCVVSAVQNYTNILMTTPSSNYPLLGQALMFLTHFMADIHQPLHAGFIEDYGGNTVQIVLQDTWLNTSLNTNMHAVWDYVILSQYQYLRNIPDDVLLANNIISSITQEQLANYNSVVDPNIIVQNSHDLAIQIYNYTGAYNLSSLPTTYYDQSISIAMSQIIKAGLRLGALLNNITATRQTAIQPPTNSSAPVPSLIVNTTTVTKFFDTLFVCDDLKSFSLANAFVSVVDNQGNILLQKGYGTTSATGNQTPTSTSIYPISSISRLFTITALMQLVEQNKLQFSEKFNDVMARLNSPYRIKSDVIGNYDSWSGAPKLHDKNDTTIENLITQTAGFDYRRFIASPTEIDTKLDLLNILTQNLPPKIRMSGDVSDDSDYGVTLLGYVIELVGNLSFSNYVQQNIIKPLGLQDTYYQANPGLLSNPNLVGPLDRSSNGNYATGFQYPYIYPGPSQGMWSSSRDLTKFMTSLLSNTTTLFNNTATVQQMFAERFTNMPVDNNVQTRTSIAALWHRRVRNNVTYVYQIGGIEPYDAALALYPTYGFGISILATGGLASSLKPILDLFVDQLIVPYTCESTPPVYDVSYQNVSGNCMQQIPESALVGSDVINQVVGCYAIANNEHTTWLKAQLLVLSPSTICISAQGSSLHAIEYNRYLFGTSATLTTNEYELIQYPRQVNQSSNPNLFFGATKSQNMFNIKKSPCMVFFRGSYMFIDDMVYEKTTNAPIFAFIVTLATLFCIATIAPLFFLIFICYESIRDCRRSNMKASDVLNLSMGEKYELGDASKSLIDKEEERDNLRSTRGYVWEDTESLLSPKRPKKEALDPDIVFEDVQKMTLRRAATFKTIKVYSKGLICSVFFVTLFSTVVLMLTSLANATHVFGMIVSYTTAIGLMQSSTAVSVFLILSIANSGTLALSIVSLFIMCLIRIRKPSVGGWIFNVLYFAGIIINLLYVPLCVYLNWYRQMPTPLGGSQ